MYKNKIQNRLIALVKLNASKVTLIVHEMSVNDTGWVWTDFVIQILLAIGLGGDKMLNFTKPFSRTQTNSLSMV